MEPRLLLSAARHVVKKVAPITNGSGASAPIEISAALAPASSKTKKGAKKSAAAGASPNSTGTTYPNQIISPSQMVGAYLGTNFNFDGVTGDGTGQTIAIIDAFDDPNLVSSSASNFSTSDLAEFDAYFNLPNPPSFTKYGVTLSNTVTSTYPGVSTSADWALEECLDVEWAHVMAPKAKIVLIEATTNNSANLFGAVQAANTLGGVSVVSMSFGFDESRIGAFSEGTYNGDFDASSVTTYIASAGDQGAYGSSSGDSTTNPLPQYPAASPYVVAVGGTSLSASSNAWSSESTWGNGTNSWATVSAGGGGGGGGTNLYESKPAYQTGFGSGGDRQYPDISLDGNPNDGVAVYDSYDYGTTTAWVPGYLGGTSLSAPLMAGLVAIADQGRALRGLVPLNSNGVSGGTDLHTLIYSLGGNSTSYAADFHDITSGNDTGPSGTPPNFSPETGYDLASGLGTPVANTLAADLAYYNVSVGSSTLAINQASITNLYFKQDSNSAYTDVWVNSATPGTGSFTYKFPDADISSLTYAGSSGNDRFTLDLSAGTALEAAGFTVKVTGNSAGTNVVTIIGASIGNTSFIASSASIKFGSIAVNFSNISTVNLDPVTGTNTLLVNGNSTGNDAFTVTSSAVVLNSTTFNLSNISLITLNPGAGTDMLAVNTGSVSIAVQTPGGGILTRNFSSISIAANASAIFATAPLHSDRMLVETAALTVNGQLDLGGNDLIVHNGNLASINALLTTGYSNGLWSGNGIDSAAAAGDTTHLTALGAIQNTLYGGSGQPTFDGTSPTASDVLIKYTYYGDTTLDGKIDGTDYSRIDNAYGTPLTGWYNGNFNYDSKVDGSDYTLIDNAFNMQAAPL